MVEHAVIMAGGSGTRLWPASIRKKPKQFIDFGLGHSLFGLTLLRALDLGLNGYICVVTHQDHVAEIRHQCRGIGEQRPELMDRLLILPEPVARNTAPAIAWAARVLQDIGRNTDTFVVLPADHIIRPMESFRDDVVRASSLAAEGWLVTFGIPPTRPETGYGYLESGEDLGYGRRLNGFKEKPDLETARQFLSQGNYFWNSGMFGFRVDVLIEQLERHAADIAGPFQGLSRSLTPQPGSPVVAVTEELNRLYAGLPAVSIDYALMEKSERCAMVQAGFEWSDVGSWDEASVLFGTQEEGVFPVSSENNFVLSDLPVALVDVRDLIVVLKNNTLLIGRKGSTQKVKEVVEKIREKNREDLL